MTTLQETGATEPAAPPPALRREGLGWLRQVGDVRVLKVKGSFYEMGRQHGALLSDEIRSGPLPYFRSWVKRALGSSLGPLSHVAWPTLQRTVGQRVARALPDFAHETIRGLADGAGLPHQQVLDGCTMPDSLMWIVARVHRLTRPGPAVAHRLRLGLGCTSALAWGDATTDGRLYHARNFDYYGVSVWPRTRTVIFHEPEAGQRYVSVSAAGVPLGGVTAMNEAGLTLTVHQHMFTDRTALGGTPIGVVGDIVMRKAETIADAQAILEAHDPIGCWTYVIADGKRREVLCFEESPDRQVAIPVPAASGTFGYTNIYLDKELGSTEINQYGSYWRHNQGRYRRTSALLAEGAGQLDAQAMAAILGDAGDPACRIRDSIAMVLTVASVVFSPEDGTVWVGTGEAPTSHGTFQPFSLVTEDHAPERGTLHVEGPSDPDAREAFELYRRAYLAYLDDQQPGEAARALEAACRLQPAQPTYHALAGLCWLVKGDPKQAEAAFDRALAVGHPDEERVASFHLWRARARDLQGRRDDAVTDYRWALGHQADPPVHKAARRGLRRPFTRRAARRINPDMSLADVITP